MSAQYAESQAIHDCRSSHSAAECAVFLWGRLRTGEIQQPETVSIYEKCGWNA